MNGYLKPGEMLIQEGAADDCCFWLQKGELEVFTHMNGEKKVIRQINEGELVGEMAFFDQQPRSCSVRAVTECQYMVLHREEFIDLVEDQPKWIKKMIDTLISRIRE